MREKEKRGGEKKRAERAKKRESPEKPREKIREGERETKKTK